MLTPSETIQRIAGTFLEDDPNPRPPLVAWIQVECRSGCFKSTLEEWAKNQPEPLRPDLVLVEKVEPEKIVLKMPGRMLDHESTSRFSLEVACELNPITLAVRTL
jgi:hypothetical protein